MGTDQRRRDALRATGKLADTAPDYGLWRRLRYPIWTVRAAELARQGHTDPATGTWRPLGLYESLHAAQLAIRADKRRPALATAVEHVVRAGHSDPRMAEIAVRTLDLDRLATQLETLVDYPAWADRLAPAITVPAANPATTTATGQPRPAALAPSERTGRPGRRDRTVARRRRVAVPTTRADPTQALFAPVTHPTRAGATPDQSRLLLAAPQADDTATGPRHLPHPNAHAHAGVPEAETAGTTTAAVEGAATEPALTTPPGPAHDAVTPPPAPAPPPAEDDDASDATELSETAAAVAYWHAHDPSLRSAQIAERVGCSVRHVRRILATLDNPHAPNTSPDVLADAHR